MLSGRFPSAETGAPPSADDLERLRRTARARNWLGLRLAGPIVWALEPIYWLYDKVYLPPEHLPVTAVLRAVLFSFGVVMHAIALKTPRRLREYDVQLSVALALAVTATMHTLIVWSGGLESDYFVGVIFVMIAVGFLFTWPLRWILTFYTLALLPFGALGVGAGGATSPEGWSHLLYVTTTAGITGFTQRFRQKLELREQLAQLELGRLTVSLESALAKLTELDRAKTEFFSNITHELRTPLTMILSPVEALLADRDELTPRQEQSLQLARKHALKQLKLVNDILDLSKIEERHLRLDLQEVDLQAFLDDIVANVADLAQRKEIEIVGVVASDVPPIWLDAEKLERAVINLIANALKFSDVGGQVRVSARREGDVVRIDVADDGIGIPEDKLETIFERFVQADASTTREYGGTGIGLAFARSIARMHGGDIIARSALGMGATFTLSLRVGREHFGADVIERRRRDEGAPVEKRADDRGAREWAQAIVENAEYRYLDVAEVTDRRLVVRTDDGDKNTRVLVVEDSLDVLQFIHSQLADKHSVYLARDGLQGLELARRERPDLVITDYMMPGLDGVGLIAAIRAEAELAEIPVVLLTAKAAPEDRRLGREVGADVYLAKPFDPAELNAVVKRLIETRGRVASNLVRAHAKSLELISAGLAHEIHNPLSWVKNAQFVIAESARKIAGAARASNDTELAAAVEKPLSRVETMLPVAERGISRIERIVELVRRYAREGYPVTAIDIEFDALARETLASGVVVPPDATLTIELGCPGVFVAGIPDEMLQVVRTLTQNALDAVKSTAGARVVVSTRCDGDRLLFCVVDDGPGIPPDLLPRIFTPFFSTKPSSEGMGLGLAITYQVVTAAQGTIRADSHVGEGTTFTVRLPISHVSSGTLSPG
ncbi:MAG: response regulator [Myxococcales bacterium]|nr:response regulator [Myxococcales bacterium]